MKHLIIIGSIYPEGFLDEFKDKCSYLDYAADAFQRSLLKGLERKFDKVDVLTYPVFKAKPNKLFIRKRISRLSFPWSGSDIHFAGFVNIPIIKKIDEFRRIIQELKILLLEKKQSYVIIYGLHSPFLLPALLLKKKIKKVMVIIPDLPEYMGGGNGFIYNIAKKIDRCIINLCISKFDCFTILSPYMRERLPISNKPSIVIEGIYSNISYLQNDIIKPIGKNILYTGLISKRYGVFDLIEAFEMINNNDYSLWLCGLCGASEEKVLLDEYIKKDSRIKYWGTVLPHEARKLQQEASLLINPRHSNEEYTKYSFPSKTMEYLASGTPTLMCRLPAIPEEYNNYLFFFDEETIEGFASKIVEVLSMDANVLKERGVAGRTFILENKSEMIQTTKIAEFLCSEK